MALAEQACRFEELWRMARLAEQSRAPRRPARLRPALALAALALVLASCQTPAPPCPLLEPNFDRLALIQLFDGDGDGCLLGSDLDQKRVTDLVEVGGAYVANAYWIVAGLCVTSPESRGWSVPAR